MIPVLEGKANLVVVAPEWHGLDEFVKGNYWNDELYIDEDKERILKNYDSKSNNHHI